uniref:Uncharacterized protein n=1 Tax=Rhizophora mucronata TaxID=61149 RepID=A0A2P2PWQ9_RHIMU
MKTLYRITI